MIRVLIVDDHAIFRRGLRSLLAEECDIEVIGEADSGPATIAAAAQLAPDVITLDIRLGGMDGIQTMRQLAQQQPQIRVIMLTTYDGSQYLTEAIQAGAHAYLLKNSSYDTLAHAIRTVYAGQRLVAPELMHYVLDNYSQLAREQVRHQSGLTAPEIEVLRLLASGATAPEIAAQMYWSEITVKRKIQDTVDKLNASNRVQAVAEAVRRGLI